eukprot:c16086_g1_i2.p1 GENE.c16086_g1_i2~~c16086_g1_i2.p1  ORF type:complete len:300 (-),score=133.25 c16086_g1_i2:23-898(-)
MIVPEQRFQLPTADTYRAHIVNVGDVITTEQGFLRGHGTLIEGEKLIATVSGVVERVNKLISVRPIRSRYTPEVGDVVVGRITEVGAKKWKVDIGSRQDATLQLSAVDLPGLSQRRKTNEDALLMRTFFQENDLISAEIQKISHDGSILLHTRSDKSGKYGKLGQGQLVPVTATLVKRCQQHFHSLSCDVDVIFGVNGYIWISPPTQKMKNIGEDGEGNNQQEIQQTINLTTRETMAKIKNSVIALSQCFIAVHSESVMNIYEETISLGIETKNMLLPENIIRITSQFRKQ